MTKLRGFSLIETVIFIVVVSIAVLAISLLFSQSVRHSTDPVLRQRAVALANAYMDEIRGKRWDENTPLGGGCVETGSNFCSSYCSTQSLPDCGVCGAGATNCEPRTNAVASLGPETGESRPDFDDVDDYHGISAQAPPLDASGTPVDGYDGYAVSVMVQHPASAWNGVDRRDVKHIVVTVDTPTGESISLQTHRVNY